MSLDEEIRRKQVQLRKQLEEEEKKRKEDAEWKRFEQEYGIYRSSPIIVEPPSELKNLIIELWPRAVKNSKKFVMVCPDGIKRARIAKPNAGYSSYHCNTFDIDLSYGEGKNLTTIAIWIFDTNKVAFVGRYNTYSELVSAGYTVNAIREKAIEIIAQHIESSSEVVGDNTVSSGCYIATAVYGSYDCPEVWVLRRFRDNILLKCLLGKVFVNCYYAISPTLVKLFSDKKWFISFWRSFLDKLIMLLKTKGYSDEKYDDK